MPRLSRLMIRVSLVWLGVGYTIGALILIQKGIPWLGWVWTLH